MLDINYKKYFIIIFLVSLILRLGLLATFKGTKIAEKYDAKRYEKVAQNLLAGKGFIEKAGKPTFQAPPVYPLFIASVYYIFGSNEVALKIVQCILDSTSSILVFLIASLVFNPIVGILAGILYSVYPPFIFYSNIKLSECLYTFILLFEAYFIANAFVKTENKYFYYAGFVHGILLLCKITTLLFPFFVFMILLITSKLRKLYLGLIFFIIISTSILSIWTIRNYRLLDTFLILNVGAGHNLWITIKDDIWDGDRLIEPDITADCPESKIVPRYKWEKILTKKVKLYILNHPFSYLGKILFNFTKMWSIPVGKVVLSYKFRAVSIIYKISFVLMLLTSAIGVYYSLRKKYTNSFIILAYILYAMFINLPIIASPRFRLPFEAFIIMFFALSLYEYKSKLQQCSITPDFNA